MLYTGYKYPSAYGKKLPWLEKLRPPLPVDTNAAGEPPSSSSWLEVEEQRRQSSNMSNRSSSQRMRDHYVAVRTNIDYGKSSCNWSPVPLAPDAQACWLSQPPSFGLAGINDVCEPVFEELGPVEEHVCWEVSNGTRWDPMTSANFPNLHIPSPLPSSYHGEGLRSLPRRTDDLRRTTDPHKSKIVKGRRSRPSKQKTEQKVPAKMPKVWEFIRNLLLDPATCPSVVRWEDPHKGVFRFMDHKKAAILWGNMKKNPKMSYEKMSRAMRYHYRNEALEVVESKRLVYKFGRKAKNWSPPNPNFESKEIIMDRED